MFNERQFRSAVKRLLKGNVLVNLKRRFQISLKIAIELLWTSMIENPTENCRRGSQESLLGSFKESAFLQFYNLKLSFRIVNKEVFLAKEDL